MRILTVAERLDAIGGLERAQLRACDLLRQRGHQIDLLYTESGDLMPEWERVAERRIQVAGYSLYRRQALASARAVAGTAARIRRLAPDLVYVHHHRHAPAVGLSGRPAVVHMHLPPPPSRSRQERLGLRSARAFVAVSRHTAGEWATWLGRPASDFAVVPNGIEIERFTPLDEAGRRRVRESLGLPPDRFLVLFAGRVGPPKGIDVALDAMGRLSGSDVHLAIAGAANPADFGGDVAAGEAYERSLRAQTEGRPVTWLGRLTDMTALLAAADVVVLPSRFPDPLPLLVLESLACGTPIVASAVGGIPEMLRGELSDLLVPPGDPAALAARIEELRGWREARPELATAGRRAVQDGFTPRQMGEGLASVFNAVSVRTHHGG